VRGRRGLVLAAVASSLLSALAAILINVTTGDTVTAHAAWLWALIAVLVLGTAPAGLWQHRLHEPTTPPVERRAQSPAELPARLPALQGRDADLTAARSLLAEAEIVLVSGPPGIGKSAFALDLAHQMRGEFADGQLFADLGGADADGRADSSAVLIGFLAALGAPTADGPLNLDRLAAMFRSAVSRKRVLVLLDNAADAAQVRPLLPGSPGCRTLVTSRSPLPDLADAVPYDPGLLTADGAPALLGEIADPARIAAEPAAVGEIISMCGRLPLALRVAARAAEVAVRGSSRTASPRETRLKELPAGELAVRTVFSTSYDALDGQDRRAFRMLGVFAGSDFSADAAAAMIMTPDPARHLSALADAQLLEALTMKRYRLHDLMRLFARERLDAEEPGTAASDALARLVGYYSRTAPAAGPAWITAEAANIAAVARQALAAGDLQAVLGQAAATHGRLLECARPAECVDLADSGVRAARLTGDRRTLAAD
jgi:DNA polymerase III delta prime subunit